MREYDKVPMVIHHMHYAGNYCALVLETYYEPHQLHDSDCFHERLVLQLFVCGISSHRLLFVTGENSLLIPSFQRAYLLMSMLDFMGQGIGLNTSYKPVNVKHVIDFSKFGAL